MSGFVPVVYSKLGKAVKVRGQCVCVCVCECVVGACMRVAAPPLTYTCYAYPPILTAPHPRHAQHTHTTTTLPHTKPRSQMPTLHYTTLHFDYSRTCSRSDSITTPSSPWCPPATRASRSPPPVCTATMCRAVLRVSTTLTRSAK
jgi:hypothetical protein